MQEQDLARAVRRLVSDLAGQTVRAFEVLAERQYYAPWAQAAARDCRDC